MDEKIESEKRENAMTAKNEIPRVERVLVAMDAENIIHSSSLAGDDRSARFSWPAIKRHIELSVSPGFDVREIASIRAYLLYGEKRFQSLYMNLQRYGFEPITVVQKYLPSVRSQSNESIGNTDNFADNSATDLCMTNDVWDQYVFSLKTGLLYHTIVLITGDGDFADLARRMKKHGVRVEVYGPAHCTSSRLKSIANQVVIMGKDDPADAEPYNKFMFVSRRREDVIDVVEPDELEDEITEQSPDNKEQVAIIERNFVEQSGPYPIDPAEAGY